jgi:hypothetical protein
MIYTSIIYNPYPQPHYNAWIDSIIPLITSIVFALLLLKFILKYFYPSREPIYIEHRKKEGWHNSLPYYRVYCSEHGYYEDHPHGVDEYFSCPECYKKLVNKDE